MYCLLKLPKTEYIKIFQPAQIYSVFLYDNQKKFYKLNLVQLVRSTYQIRKANIKNTILIIKINLNLIQEICLHNCYEVISYKFSSVKQFNFMSSKNIYCLSYLKPLTNSILQ